MASHHPTREIIDMGSGPTVMMLHIEIGVRPTNQLRKLQAQSRSAGKTVERYVDCAIVLSGACDPGLNTNKFK